MFILACLVVIRYYSADNKVLVVELGHQGVGISLLLVVAFLANSWEHLPESEGLISCSSHNGFGVWAHCKVEHSE